MKGIFVIGVRKCGTTTVFDFLKNTRAFRTGSLKEPQFFCLSDDIVRQNTGWYASHFGHDDSRPVLDGSTLYYPVPEIRSRIAAHFSEAKFVVCLRDPARRMYSAYWHQRGKPGRPERRNFDEILDNLEVTAGVDLFLAEQAALEQALATGSIAAHDPPADYHRRHFGAGFRSEGLDPFAFYRYAGESLYSRHADRWLDQPDTHFVFFETLLKSPGQTLGQLAGFAGLPLEKSAFLPANRNKTYDAGRFPWLNRLARTGLLGILKRTLPDPAKHYFKAKFLPEAEKMTPRQYQRARSLFKNEYEFWTDRYPVLAELWQ